MDLVASSREEEDTREEALGSKKTIVKGLVEEEESFASIREEEANIMIKNEQESDNNSCEDRTTNHATEEDKSVSIQCSSVHGNSNMKLNRLYATPQRSAAPKLQKPVIDKAAQKLGDKFKRKSHMTQPTLLVRPRSALSRKKENGLVGAPCKQQQFSVIDEKSSNLQPNEVAKACNNGDSSTNKAYRANSNSRSRPKKTITVPKEPNFQSLHVPKSCTKKVT